MADIRISMIAAIGEKGELGKDNALLWHIPGELPRFKRITMGHPIIMGRKTFESIGRVLPGRPHIIITRDTTFSSPEVVVVHSVQEAIEKGKEIEDSRVKIQELGEIQNTKYKIRNTENEVFVIGGGQIFKEALPMTDRLYLTLVHKVYPDADTFFPDYSDFTKVIEKEEHMDNDPSYTFLTLEK